MTWLWYVAADFQLYCLSFVIVFLIHRLVLHICLLLMRDLCVKISSDSCH